MDDKLNVIHRVSEDIREMRKAKYIESNITKVYKEIKKELLKKRTVLFSGTPCQCQAIKGYFSEYDDKLICVALMCRGVQSIELWKEYILYLGKDEKVIWYDFRNKLRCDNAHTVAYKLGNNEYYVDMNSDRFSRIYIKGLSLRPSCYKCVFCRKDLNFDFSIGDFWGIERFHPEMNDGKGTSLVIARGEKADTIIENIKNKAKVKVCNIRDIDQPALRTPAKETILRNFFFKDLALKNHEGHCDMELILKKYGF